MRSHWWEEYAVDDGTAAVDELIAEACELVGDQRAHPPVALALVHDELAAAAAICEDPATVADAREVLAELERAVAGGGGAAHTLPIAS